jgi:hypothetical protein
MTEQRSQDVGQEQVIWPWIATVYIYIYIINFILIKFKIYVFYLLGMCEYKVNNQSSNIHSYVMSPYFLHKFTYYTIIVIEKRLYKCELILKKCGSFFWKILTLKLMF